MYVVYMKVTCDNCGEKFTKKGNEVERYNHNFCSQKCYGEYKTKHKLGSKKGLKPDMSQFEKLKKLARERNIR